MNPKKPEHRRSFTSFRIIGEKAQKLLRRAKEMQAKPDFDRAPALPEPEQHEQLLVHLSVPSVVQTTFTILAIAFGVMLAYFLLDKIVLFLLAIFIAAVIDPGVRALSRMGIPRGIGILVHYFVALFLFFFLLISLIPIIAMQITDIARLINDNVNAFLLDPQIWVPLLPAEVNAKLTVFMEATLRDLSITHFTDAMQQMGQNLSTAAQGSLTLIANLAGSVLNFFVNLVLVLVLAFFIQIEKERMISWVRGFLPWRYRAYFDDKSEVISWKLAQWARGQLILCASIGLLVFLALVVLRMPYALTLAMLAAFTEFIPVIGPFIAAVPAVLIGWTQEGFVWALVIALIYYVIQWCENNLLVPLIMKRAVGLSATSIMFAMLVGVSFPFVIHPVIGIMLSIPVTTILSLFIEDWRDLRRRQHKVVESKAV